MYIERIKSLQAYGFVPKQFVDVGCNDGSWSQLLSYNFPTSNFFLIDANKRHEQRLKKLNFTYEICLLGDLEKEVNFYMSQSGNGTGDSIFKENTVHYENCEIQKLKCKTLDSVLESRKIFYIDYLKIDCQGSELLILDGAKKTLKNTTFIQLEVSTQNYNINSPKFYDYVDYMKKNNFFCYDIVGLNYIDNCLISMDILFTSKHEQFKPKSLLK
jgi:FkbM family methyltransferase